MIKEPNLVQTLEKIHNHIYANEGLTSNQAFDEVIKLLFIKIFDESNRLGFFFISNEEKKKLEKAGFSKTFKSRIEDLFTYTKSEFKKEFDKKEKISLKLQTIGFIVNELTGFTLLGNSNLHGLLYQKYISEKQKSERGQFFTPVEIVKMCIKLINPQKNEIILDPACGSGNFLIEAFRDNKINTQVYGFEINANIARVAALGFIINGLRREQIININALESIGLINKKVKMLDLVTGVDIIFANPPFGASGKIRSPNILKRFSLGKRVKSQTPEILFIEQIIKMLKHGGRAAVVLPQGIFENSKYAYVREYIRQESQLTAVIDLPAGVFEPYGTSIKTSILLIEKTKRPRSKTFFGKVTKVGYKMNKNGKADYKNGEIDQDLDNILKKFGEFKHKTLKNGVNCYQINESKITDRFDFEFNKPENQNFLEQLRQKNYIELGEIADFIRNKQEIVKTHKYKYIEINSLNYKYFEINSNKRLLGEKLPERASSQVKIGDILIPLSGNWLGTTKHAIALVDGEHDGAIVSNSIMILRKLQIDPYYFLHFTKQEEFIKQIRLFRTGTTVPMISEQNLKKVLIKNPSFDEIKSVRQIIKEPIDLRRQSGKLIFDAITAKT